MVFAGVMFGLPAIGVNKGGDAEGELCDLLVCVMNAEISLFDHSCVVSAS